MTKTMIYEKAKNWLSIVLALLMLIQLTPLAALAEELSAGNEGQTVLQEAATDVQTESEQTASQPEQPANPPAKAEEAQQEDGGTAEKDDDSVVYETEQLSLGVHYKVDFYVDDELVEGRYYQKAGEPIGKLPETEQRQGYDFLGWKNGDVPVTEETMVEEDMVLRACYEKYVYTLKKSVELDGQTYQVTVSYHEDAEIPETATLEAEEVDAEEYLKEMADVLEWGEEAYILYTKFLDITILDEDGNEIEPKSAVTVTVELADMEDKTESMQVVHFTESGAQELQCETTEESSVVFETESFSVFGIGNALHSLAAEETEAANIAILSSASKDASKVTESALATEIEGIEVLKAFDIEKAAAETTEEEKLWVRTALNADAGLTETESVVLYDITGHELNEVLAENISEKSSLISVSPETEGVALVRDSGFRHLTFRVNPDEEDAERLVVLDGLMPKNASAEIHDVTEKYADLADIKAQEPEPAPLPESGKLKLMSKPSLLAAPQAVLAAENATLLSEDNIENSTKGVGRELEEGEQVTLAAYQILVSDGETDYTPGEENPVLVSIQDERIVKNRRVQLWNVTDAGQVEEVESFVLKNGSITFEANAFNVYAVTTIIEKTITASDGRTYKITVEYGKDANLPDNIDLDVFEVLEDSDAYEDCLAQSLETVGFPKVYFTKLLDISIVDADNKETHYQPEAPVEVTIELLEMGESPEDAMLTVVHLGEEAETMDADVDETSLNFMTDGFSIYTVVQGPEPIAPETENAKTLSDLFDQFAQDGFYLSVYRSSIDYYFTGEVKNGCLKETQNIAAATPFFLEQDEDDPSLCYIYIKNGNEKRYLAQDAANNNGNNIKFAAEGSLFAISEAGGGRFYIKHADSDRWLQHSNGGNGIRFWTDNKNAANSKVLFTYTSTTQLPADVYNLDGKTYGLLYYNNDGVYGYSLEAETKTQTKLNLQALAVRTNPMNRVEKLYVAKNSSISMWTFHNVREDVYLISSEVNGETKYLRIENNALKLGTEEEATEITVYPGTGEFAGKVRLTWNDYAAYLYMKNGAGESFGAEKDNKTHANKYFYLVDLSELTDEDFVVYSARKVSVSDESVTNGSRVIIYTRFWDDAAKKYLFYAVDSDGSLVQCFESGDSINWIGMKLNTMLWNFTEYYWEGTNEPNYYYDLKNPYSGEFLAPQISDTEFLSDSPIGVNMDGRKYRDYYSTIIAWDDPHYAYAGLKVENGRIVSCPFAEAGDFYFAIMQDTPPEGELTEVPTVEHTQYGIYMKVVDFDGNEGMNSFLGNSGSSNLLAPSSGLLSTNLGSDGYPTAAGGSLGNMYAGARDVNHLFITSTFNGSGYYEYDSTQNYAYLEDSGNFKVYANLGTTDLANRPSMKHGQFFPLNDLDASKFASINDKNLYSATQQELSENDPRKYEQMYLVPTPNYHFGIEIGASFVQTPSGRDAWGHDVIYEFTGDDDFWLYVDGELVIDLGGIHSALPGSVNYCTGQVMVNGQYTTLYDTFRSNYEKRGMGAAEIASKLDELFEEKTDASGNTYYTFKDYTMHSMKIFFMERGAGASNLHMRFNLTSVKPGQVVLNKRISGTDKNDYKFAEYAYQILYKLEGDEDFSLLEDVNIESRINVTYQNTNIPVKYAQTYSPAGSSLTYDNVFFLTPNQTVLISVPSDSIAYKIRECGVNAQVYDVVKVNDDEVEAVETEDPARVDYETAETTVSECQRVIFDNHVSPNAKRSLTITKKLYDVEDNLITDDPTGFNLRLYLGNENESVLKTAALQDYHVKNAHDEYCYWDANLQRFVSTGKTNFDSLTDAEKTATTFQTSFNGAISKIPAEYKVEVRNLLVGSKFLVEERPDEVPAGYSFIEYARDGFSYIVSGDAVNSGTIRDNESPAIEVHNRRGFGITANKVWSDNNFMDYHEDVYFAVYVGETMLPDSVKAIQFPKKSVYYFWDGLVPGASGLQDYHVYEVLLQGDNIQVDPATRNVTGYTGVTKLAGGTSFQLTAKAKDEQSPRPFDYAVSYTVGPIGGQANNVRTDTVTNSRHGIRLVKQTWNGNPLQGAKFRLSDAAGNPVGTGTYTSGEDGLIDIVYVNVDTEYTLEETSSPHGYHGNKTAIKFRLDSETREVEITQGDSLTYTVVQETAQDMATIYIKNRQFVLQAVKQGIKIDGTTELLEGIPFALYREVTVDGVTSIDYAPIEGYESLITRPMTAVIPKITQELPVGNYYLKELTTPEGYKPIAEPIRFTIDEMGEVELTATNDAVLNEEINGNGEVSYTIVVKNKTAEAYLTIQKVVAGDIGDRRKSFTFTLAQIENETAGKSYSWTKTSSDNSVTTGTIQAGGTFTLANGESIKLVLPTDKPIHLEEDDDYYETQWVCGTAAAVEGTETVITLESDTTCVVTNTLNAVSPTGFHADMMPYLAMLLAACMILLLKRSKYDTANLP